MKITPRSGIPTPIPMPTPSLALEGRPEPLLLTSSIEVLLAISLLAPEVFVDIGVECVDVELIESVSEAKLAEG